MSPHRFVYLVEFVAMFGVWLAVALTYHFMSGGRWRRTPEGRHVMSFAAVFVWVTALILANMVFGQYPGRFWVGVSSYGFFIILGLRRLELIVRAQRERRRRSGGQASCGQPTVDDRRG